MPPPPPSPAPSPAGSMLLFNVVTDPGERHEVSAEHPDIVKRLSGKLNAMRATAVAAKDKLICGNRTHVHTDQGSYVVPHCNISRA